MSKALTLPARLDYAALEGLHAEIREARGQDLTLDASNVTHLGASALQLLISAKKSWDQDGHSLALQSPSQRFSDHLNMLGLEGSFFPQAAGGAA